MYTYKHTRTHTHLYIPSIRTRIRGPNNRVNTGEFNDGRMCVHMKMAVRLKIC